MQVKENLEFSEQRRSLSDTDLDAFEQSKGIKLPPGYRDFLKAHNGGRVHPRYVRMPGANNAVGGINFFLSIGDPEDSYALEKAWDMYNDPRWPPRMPPEFLPIAEDEGGNLFCLVTEGHKTGQIYFWDHEEEGIDSYTYDNLYFVAESIDALLASLYDEPVDFGDGEPSPDEE